MIRRLLASRKLFLAALALALLVLVLDQASKYAVLKHASELPRAVLPFFNLVLVFNKGVSFGLFNAQESSPYLFSLLAIVIVFFLVRWLATCESRVAAAGLGLLIGGAIGNVFDRLLHGAVVDFLDFHAFGHHWPAFNIADSAVVIGVGLLLLQSLVFDTKRGA